MLCASQPPTILCWDVQAQAEDEVEQKESRSRNQQCASFLGGNPLQILPVFLKVVRI